MTFRAGANLTELRSGNSRGGRQAGGASERRPTAMALLFFSPRAGENTTGVGGDLKDLCESSCLHPSKCRLEALHVSVSAHSSSSHNRRKNYRIPRQPGASETDAAIKLAATSLQCRVFCFFALRPEVKPHAAGSRLGGSVIHGAFLCNRNKKSKLLVLYTAISD